VLAAKEAAARSLVIDTSCLSDAPLASAIPPQPFAFPRPGPTVAAADGYDRFSTIFGKVWRMSFDIAYE
jgi:hypothetical protein